MPRREAKQPSSPPALEHLADLIGDQETMQWKLRLPKRFVKSIRKAAASSGEEVGAFVYKRLQPHLQ